MIKLDFEPGYVWQNKITGIVITGGECLEEDYPNWEKVSMW